MAMATVSGGVGPTKLQNLLDPQVLGAYLDVKLIDKIKLAPIAEINRELEGRPGSTITFPKWGYIGDAADLAEGAALSYTDIAEDTVEIKVKKVAKGVSITDEAVLSGYGNPVEQIGQQLLTAVASKIEADMYDAVDKEKKATRDTVGCFQHQYNKTNGFTKEDIIDMRAKFGEDQEGEMVLFVNPAEFAKLAKDRDFVQIQQGAQIISGEMGMLYGVRLVVANRVPAGKPFLMKPGALAIVMKRNVMVESERDMDHFATKYAVSDHYVCYVKYADRIVKAAPSN